jgi:membrane associated rhomboid family serine protease
VRPVANLLLGLGLSAAAVAGLSALRASAVRRREAPPLLTLACAVVISACSVAQLGAAPNLLPLLMRDGRLLSAQPWRLATSLLVQDGGWAGAFFNIAGFLVIGSVAERLLGVLRWTLVAGASVAVAQAAAMVWQPVGAGNSILTVGLAGAACAVCFVRHSAPAAALPAAAATACFAILFFMRDIHGAAAMTGAAVAFGLQLLDRRRGQAPRG